VGGGLIPDDSPREYEMDKDTALLDAARDRVRREASGVGAVAEQLDASFLATVHLLHGCAGKVFVTGSGTSGAMARRMAHLLAVCGTPSVFLPAMDALHGTMGAVTSQDVLIVISRGGESDELNQLTRRITERGAQVVALTGAPHSTLAGLADITAVLGADPDVDPGDVIAMGSTLVAGVWGDALAYVLMRLRGYGWERVLHTHPAGAVGRLDALPDELDPFDERPAAGAEPGGTGV
jgi:D-arabinose 5-phosphate isomerase GutQ